MIYHVGNLQYDRSHRTERGRAVAKVAREAWRKYIAGEIDLFQRRVTPDICEYHAIPRPRPHIPVVWLGGRKHKICGPRSSSLL